MKRAGTRRQFLAATMGGGLMGAVLRSATELRAAPRLHVTGIELLPVRATERTVWLIVRLRTDEGLTGLGEASDAFGFANTTKQDAARMESELHRFFALIEGKSPLDIGAYRQQAERLVTEGGLVSATAYSAVEQALWDIVGKSLDVADLYVVWR
jgi:galactonate dehydratase